MLRQALDAAEGERNQQEQQQQQEHEQQYRHSYANDERTGLGHALQSASIIQADLNRGYGTAESSSHHMTDGGGYGDGEDDEDDDDDDEYDSQAQSYDGEYFNDSDSDDWRDPLNDSRRVSLPEGILKKTWGAIRSCFLLVANVENLWDSPVVQSRTHYSRLPPSQQHREYSYQQEEQHQDDEQNDDHSRRSFYVVLFWFFILIISYTIERSSFKLLVDRTGPFRLFSAEMVAASHALMLALGIFISALYHRDFKVQPLGIPLIDVGLMALLDTTQLLLVFLTGIYVPPVLTVILVQFTLPLTALLAQFVHSDGRCSCRSRKNDDDDDDDSANGSSTPNHPDPEQPASNTETTNTDNNGYHTSNSYDSNNNISSSNLNTPQHHNGVSNNTSNNRNNNPRTIAQQQERHVVMPEGTPLPGWGGLSAEHLWGSIIIAVAVIMSLIPALYSISDPDFFIYADPIPIQPAYNTMVYVSSCIPAAASQMYKEHVFLQYKQPVNVIYLNLLLSVLQFILVSVMSPLVYGLQGLGGSEDWTTLYPSKGLQKNFLNGMKCFLNILDEDIANNTYPEDAECGFSFPLCILYSFSIISVGVAVDKIVNAGATKLMYRGISAGIIVAMFCMFFYDLALPRFNYGPAVDGLNLFCLIVLIVGTEVYHRVSLKGATYQTTYPQLDNLYDADDDDE